MCQLAPQPRNPPFLQAVALYSKIVRSIDDAILSNFPTGMFNRLQTWLDARTSVPTLAHKMRNWTVPNSRPFARYIPALIIFLFIVQVVTGIMLWMFYSPSAQSAWESLFYLQFILPGGWLVRGIHHYTAQLMPILLGCYILCMIFTGRYRSPREFVFWTACVMFLFSLGFSLTGDLLNWTLSGFHATLVRVRFLQILPFVGEPLFRIVCGGAEFGTLTLPRFMVLHVLVLGGGFFALLCLWLFFDYRAAKLERVHNPEKAQGIPLFSNEILKYSVASLAAMAVVLLLVYKVPILNRVHPDAFPINENLPRQASLGVKLGAPADPAGTYNAARPEWSFRALYHFCNLKHPNGDEVFPGELKYIPIFVVTSCIGIYVFLIPVIGRLLVGHFLNVLVMGALFVSLCYLTIASYHHDYIDPSMQAFRDEEAAAGRLAERAIELALLQGIPPTGALTLLHNDPYLQGPALYKQHCIMCHAFEPMEGESAYPGFMPILSEDKPVAPNLYHPIRREWIAGFLCPDRIRNADYYGNTVNWRDGAMVRFVRDELPDALADAEMFDDERAFDELIDFLLSEAQRDAPRTAAEPTTQRENAVFASFNCGLCHATYEPNNRPSIQAPDLRGYMSRDWMIGIIANPTSTRFYGPVGNTSDRMPAYHLDAESALMTMHEIELLVDWLRGHWQRINKSPGIAVVKEETVVEKPVVEEITVTEE